MQKLSVKDYHILIRQEPNYSFNSSDNKYYDKILSIVADGESYAKTISLTIEREGLKQEIALIVPYHTNTDHCGLPAGDRVFLMLDDRLCLFDPETLNMDKLVKIDPIAPLSVPCSYGQDFILYGELDVFRIGRDLSVRWRFSGKDIFVSFEMKDDRICLYDLEGGYYEISYDGKLIG